MEKTLCRCASHLSRGIIFVALLFSIALRGNTQTPGKVEPQPLGTLVDVGGYRVHLYCLGRGSPTVMIVGAAFSFDWGLVQPEVARFTRVCTFDASGTAWSDPPPVAVAAPSSEATDSGPVLKATPTCADRVDEIHRLIAKTPIDGPYVLVGFSVGALWERLYASEYPNSIAGMVIVDHAFLPNIPEEAAPKQTAPASSPRGYSPPVLISKAPIVLGFEDDWNFSKLPEHDQELHKWALSRNPVRPGYEMATDCFSRIKRVTGERAYPLGDMPLVVISTANEAPDYLELQAKLVALSHRGKQIIAENSSHMVPIDQPEVIVRAIREIVEIGRRK